MKKLNLFFIISIALSLIPATTQAASHTLGTNISASGTVYTITTENGQIVRRPYTSAGAFLSYGYNSWAAVQQANADDATLPVGSFIAPREGSIVCSDRGSDEGTCYLISQAQKFGFPSVNIFTSQGFSFSHALYGDVSFLPDGGVISDAAQPHEPGVIINEKGTLYFVNYNGGLDGFPTANVFTGWGYSFADSVPANAADEAKLQTAVLNGREPGQLTPNEGDGSGKPSIASVDPTSGPAGTQITIHGSNFTTTGNNIVSDNVYLATNVGSADGKTLSFEMPLSVIGACNPPVTNCAAYNLPITPKDYEISVKNVNGISNSVIFTVTGSSLTSTSTPVVSGISPSSGPVGTSVTLTGSGFTSQYNQINTSNLYLAGTSGVASTDGTTLRFTIPSSAVVMCAQGTCAMQQVMPGNYTFTVSNSNGNSNSVNFTITGQ